MKYGYVEGGATSYFVKTLTPPFLSKIGLSAHHPQFVFLGYKKSILNWMRQHSHLKIELNDNTQPGMSNITFEITNIYNVPFSPYQCNIRATKHSDYQESPKERSTPENTRIIIVRSGKTLGEVLLLLRVCWRRNSRTRYICTSNQNEVGFVTGHLTPTQEFLQSNALNYTIMGLTIPLEPSPSYRSIDSYSGIRPFSCELPSYYSSVMNQPNTTVA
ncbi:hypothetical protein K7432_013007 [Basidiobolus ranarum]|uniref:Uncharacterized protein n=1 Tax=Basidiobolus ranarum TaxID=34480 RepID=A0ABR2WK14_9FUNG